MAPSTSLFHFPRQNVVFYKNLNKGIVGFADNLLTEMLDMDKC